MRDRLISSLFLGCFLVIKNISTTKTDGNICDMKSVDYHRNKQLSRMESAGSSIENIYINKNAEVSFDKQQKAKQIKDSQVNEEDKFLIDTKKVNELNINMRSIEETTFKNVFCHLSTLVKSNEQCTRMWYKMTQIFKKIYENYSNIILQEKVDFDALEKTNSFNTVEVIDYFYETFMIYSARKEFLTLRFVSPFYLLKDKNIESKLCKIEDYSLLENILSFHAVVSSRIGDLDLEDLTKLLLYKISVNKMEIGELNSIILAVFYNYPTDENALNDIDHINKLKNLIGKTIVLINIANASAYINIMIPKDRLLKSVNELIERCLFVYLYKGPNGHNYINRLKPLKKAFKNYKNQNTPVKQDNLIFLKYFIAPRGYIIKNYVKPVEILLEYFDFNTIPYFYLLKTIGRLNRLAEFIVDNTKQIYNFWE